MEPPRRRIPSPRTLAIGAVIVAVLGGLWLHARARRLEVERAASTVASAIAGRAVHARCPGPIRRRVLYEVNDGSVMFTADGRPADETKLSARTCDGLRRVLDRRAALDLACLSSTACSDDDEQAAAGLAVLTHESVHLRGVMDESATECEARKRVATTARTLGLTEHSAARLAAWQATTWAEMLPERYRACAQEERAARAANHPRMDPRKVYSVASLQPASGGTGRTSLEATPPPPRTYAPRGERPQLRLVVANA